MLPIDKFLLSLFVNHDFSLASHPCELLENNQRSAVGNNLFVKLTVGSRRIYCSVGALAKDAGRPGATGIAYTYDDG